MKGMGQGGRWAWRWRGGREGVGEVSAGDGRLQGDSWEGGGLKWEGETEARGGKETERGRQWIQAKRSQDIYTINNQDTSSNTGRLFLSFSHSFHPCIFSITPPFPQHIQTSRIFYPCLPFCSVIMNFEQPLRDESYISYPVLRMMIWFLFLLLARRPVIRPSTFFWDVLLPQITEIVRNIIRQLSLPSFWAVYVLFFLIPSTVTGRGFSTKWSF